MGFFLTMLGKLAGAAGEKPRTAPGVSGRHRVIRNRSSFGVRFGACSRGLVTRSFADAWTID